MGRRGWSAMPIPDGWVQVIRGSRPKSENWPRANPSAPLHKGAQGGTSAQQGRWRNSSGAGLTKLQSLEAALAVLSPEESGARAELQAAAQRQGGAETIATIFTDSGCQGGRSSCQGVRVGESFGRIGRHQRGRGRGNQEGSRESQSSCTREASHRVDCRSQGGHRSRRKTINVGDRSVGRRSCPSCTSGKPKSRLVCLRGLRPQHCRGGSIVDETPTTRDGGSNLDVSRLARVIAEVAAQLRQWTQPPPRGGNMVS